MYNYENLYSGGDQMSTGYDLIFGKNLRSVRMSCKMTQTELSEKLKAKGYELSVHDINEIEMGKRYVYPHELKAFHLALNVSYDVLLP